MMIDVEAFSISKKLFATLVHHAMKVAPYESVAIIAGKVKGKKAIAKRVFTPENTDNSTVSFTVDPIILLTIYLEIEQREEQLIGIYHTHPASPYPSSTDRRYMEVNPCVWLISSTRNPAQPKGFLLQEDGRLKEVIINFTEK